MKWSLPKYNAVRVAVVLLGDRLAVAAVSGERVETFSIATENPAAALREELTARQIAPRSVALGLARTAAFVKPIDLPTVGGDVREMLRLNLEGHVPFAADDAAFDFVPLAPVAEPDYTPRAQARLAALAPEERGAHMLALATASARGGRPLDLLPVPLRPRRLTKAQAFTLGVATVATLLLITALLVPSWREQRQLARINVEITRVDPDVRSVERVLRDLERKRKLLATINGIEANAMRPLPVLRELTELLPSDTWLTTLALDQKGVELTGQAAAASALIPLLENSPVLERVEFSSPVTRGRDKEQFRIRAAWEAGGAQARTATPVSTPVAVPPVVGVPPAGPTPPPGAAPPIHGDTPTVPGGGGAPTVRG